MCPPQAAGEHAGAQAKGAVVGECDRLFVVAERHHDHHGAKHLLTPDPHGGCHARQDGGREKVALSAVRMHYPAAGKHLQGQLRSRTEVGFRVLEFRVYHLR